MPGLMRPFALLTMFTRDELSPFLAVLLGTAIGLLSCAFLNKLTQQHTLKTCNRNLNQVVISKTFVGDTYYCVSRKVLYGPAAPLKP